MEIEIMRDLLESLKEAVIDGEAVLIDSGCGEVTDMISSCGIENIEKFAEDYEKKALELAEKEGWEVVEVNNCKAVKKTKGDEMTKRALIILNHKPVQGIYKDLEELGVEQVDLLQDVNPDLAKKFANVPFDKKEVIKISKELALFISGLDEEKEYLISINKNPKYDIVIIAGEPRLISNTLYWFYYGDEYAGVNKANYVRFFTPYSERVSEDIKQSDGSIKKVSRFIYRGLAEY